MWGMLLEVSKCLPLHTLAQNRHSSDPKHCDFKHLSTSWLVANVLQPVMNVSSYSGYKFVQITQKKKKTGTFLLCCSGIDMCTFLQYACNHSWEYKQDGVSYQCGDTFTMCNHCYKAFPNCPFHISATKTTYSWGSSRYEPPKEHTVFFPAKLPRQ